jgi:hypothetical protein
MYVMYWRTCKCFECIYDKEDQFAIGNSFGPSECEWIVPGTIDSSE